MWMEGRTLVVPISYKRFFLPRRVRVDLSLYEETFNMRLQPWERTPPSRVWAFGSGDKTWCMKRYAYLWDAARSAAHIARVAGTESLTLLPLVRVLPRDVPVYPELVMKQMEFVRSIGQDDLFNRSAVISTAAMVGLEELVSVLHAVEGSYGLFLTQFGQWRMNHERDGTSGTARDGEHDGTSRHPSEHRLNER